MAEDVDSWIWLNTVPEEMITYYIPQTLMSGTVSVTVMKIIPPEFMSVTTSVIKFDDLFLRQKRRER
eukprot:2589293-Amphidinium_carterae.1